MSGIITPRPSNLTVPASHRFTEVDSDVYNICTRIKEIDPNLRVIMHENHAQPWVVVERGPDGEERFVSRYAELDARILENLRYMLAVPFEKRLAIVEKKVDENNAKIGKLTEEQMDKLAYDMQKALVESQIADPVWGRSYRNTKGKKGVALMGMTFTQLKDRAIALGNYGTGDDTNMGIFINMAKRDVEGRPEKWLWMRTSATLSTVASTRTVAVPALMKEHGGLYATTNTYDAPQWVDYPSYDPLGESIDYQSTTPTGRPTVYTISEGAFVFDPVPNAVYAYKHVYEAFTADFSSGSDTSTIPDGHEDVLIYGALMHFAARDKDRNQMAFWQDMYEGRLNKLVTQNTMIQNKSIQKISLPAHYYGAYDY